MVVDCCRSNTESELSSKQQVSNRMCDQLFALTSFEPCDRAHPNESTRSSSPRASPTIMISGPFRRRIVRRHVVVMCHLRSTHHRSLTRSEAGSGRSEGGVWSGWRNGGETERLVIVRTEEGSRSWLHLKEKA